MQNEISNVKETTISAAEVKSHVVLIQEVLSEVMKKGTHYDTIKGCGDKPVLLKPGAEKILATFNLAPEIIVDDLSTDDNKFYRVIVKIHHQQSGRYLGDGVGECSSLESKYAWRAAVCDEEFDETPESLRRLHFKKQYKPDYENESNQKEEVIVYKLNEEPQIRERKETKVRTVRKKIILDENEESELKELRKLDNRDITPEIRQRIDYLTVKYNWFKENRYKYKDRDEMVKRWQQRWEVIQTSNAVVISRRDAMLSRPLQILLEGITDPKERAYRMRIYQKPISYEEKEMVRKARLQAANEKRQRDLDKMGKNRKKPRNKRIYTDEYGDRYWVDENGNRVYID